MSNTRHRTRRSRGLDFFALATRTPWVRLAIVANPLQRRKPNVVTRLLAVQGVADAHSAGWRALPTTKNSGAPITYGYIEDLRFAVDVFDEGGNLKEVPARLHDLAAAGAAYTACRTKRPAKIIYLCQGGRTLQRSDRD
jgi:hypothetical protein